MSIKDPISIHMLQAILKAELLSYSVLFSFFYLHIIQSDTEQKSPVSHDRPPSDPTRPPAAGSSRPPTGDVAPKPATQPFHGRNDQLFLRARV